MKREFLKELGIEDKEVIDKIMSENGTDIEKAKGKADDYKSQLETAKADLTKAQKTITELEGKKGDAEALQAEIDKYKQAEADRLASEEQAKADKAMLDRFEGVVGEGKFINDFTKNGVLSEFKKALGDEANKGKGDKEVYEALVKDKDGIFVNPNQLGNMGGMGNINTDIDTSKIRAVMGLPEKSKE